MTMTANQLTKVKFLYQPRPTIDPKEMPDGPIELWSVPDFDIGRPSITSREHIGSSKKVIFPGDVLLSKIVPHIRRTWVVKTSCLPQYASTEWLVFNSPAADSKYLAYALISDSFNAEILKNSNGMGSLRRANPEKVGNQTIWLPTLEQQRNIVNNLDQKCSNLDSLIEKLTFQKTKLAEYQNSLILEVISRGLNPNIRLKDSGLPWIGMIPRHWKLQKVKFNFRKKVDRNPGNAEVLSLYRDFGVVIKKDRTDNHNRTSEDTSNYLFIRQGDLVVNKMKAWQGSLAFSKYEGIVSPAYYVYELTSNEIDRDYLNLLFKAGYRQEFERLSTGVREGQWDLSAHDFENTLLVIPPLDEQKEIAKFVKHRINIINNLELKLQKATDKLTEYRSTLITEAVTGKLDLSHYRETV